MSVGEASASLELRGIENLAQDLALCQGRTRSWEARLKLEADAATSFVGLNAALEDQDPCIPLPPRQQILNMLQSLETSLQALWRAPS